MPRHRFVPACTLLEDRTVPSPVPLTAGEQYFLELINRARANPAAEAARYGINLNEGLPPGTISTAAKQPLASHAVLHATIRSHLIDLQTNNLFQHESSNGTTFQQRINQAGYNFGAGENLAIGTRFFGSDKGDIDWLHEGLFVDGDIPGRGHRTNMMEPSWVEAGSGYHTGMFQFLSGAFDSALVGNDFGSNSGNLHYLTGVAYSDSVIADSFYTPGEGLSGVTVTVVTSGNVVVAVESVNGAGGYQIPLAPGTYDVIASGGGLPAPVTFYNVVIGSQNVKRDFTPGGGQAAPPGASMPAGTRAYSVGADSGAAPMVKVVNPANGNVRFHFYAYEPTFRGGVRVVTADMNGDNVPDIITAPGPGRSPTIKVFSGANHSLLASFNAYGADFGGGVQLAVGNLDGDPALEIAAGAGFGGGPHVRVFDLAGTQMPGPLGSFLAYAPSFTGGVFVAAGNVDGLGSSELIVGAGRTGGPHVQTFRQNGTLVNSFFAYAPTFTGGIYVGAGDTNGDGLAEIITGTGFDGGPHVKVFQALTQVELASFFAYAPSFTGGVRIGLVDADGNGSREIAVAAGPTGGPHARLMDGVTLATRHEFFAFDPSFTGGIWVG